ncbi:hypothetical protein BJ508DRAFT_82723 [Ascobolus immersus RN42]|uniref:Uncharacterized protein n=1 Tax=Ascobolus immersus RN42 TaxID=1160509 RepID=A0A3N4HBU1_ASCIM|nr:hypothetical protein BJ508DRAFT_82723 [Ascobolus immersus RN42]
MVNAIVGTSIDGASVVFYAVAVIVIRRSGDVWLGGGNAFVPVVLPKQPCPSLGVNRSILRSFYPIPLLAESFASSFCLW